MLFKRAVVRIADQLADIAGIKPIARVVVDRSHDSVAGNDEAPLAHVQIMLQHVAIVVMHHVARLSPPDAAPQHASEDLRAILPDNVHAVAHRGQARLPARGRACRGSRLRGGRGGGRERRRERGAACTAVVGDSRCGNVRREHQFLGGGHVQKSLFLLLVVVGTLVAFMMKMNISDEDRVVGDTRDSTVSCTHVEYFVCLFVVVFVDGAVLVCQRVCVKAAGGDDTTRGGSDGRAASVCELNRLSMKWVLSEL